MARRPLDHSSGTRPLTAMCNHERDGHVIELGSCETCRSQYEVCSGCRRILISCECGNYLGFEAS